MESLYKGQVGDGSFGPWREVVLLSEVTNALSLWEVLGGGGGGGVSCPLFRGCPLLGGNKYTITMGSIGGPRASRPLFRGCKSSFVQRLSSSRRFHCLHTMS